MIFSSSINKVDVSVRGPSSVQILTSTHYYHYTLLPLLHYYYNTLLPLLHTSTHYYTITLILPKNLLQEDEKMSLYSFKKYTLFCTKSISSNMLR